MAPTIFPCIFILSSGWESLSHIVPVAGSVPSLAPGKDRAGARVLD